MGVRGEVFTTKVALQNRTYFFNVKENRLGDLYLNIVESKNKEPGGFERQSIILFADDLREFLTGFDESLKIMEKEIREKRKGEKPRMAKYEPSGYRSHDGEKPRMAKHEPSGYRSHDGENKRMPRHEPSGYRSHDSEKPRMAKYEPSGNRTYDSENKRKYSKSRPSAGYAGSKTSNTSKPREYKKRDRDRDNEWNKPKRRVVRRRNPAD